MTINLASIEAELRPGLAAVKGKYRERPAELDDLFARRTSEMEAEYITQMRFMGLAQVKRDGGEIAYDNNPGQRYKYGTRHVAAAIGTVFTRQALADNLYKKEFGPTVIGFQKSMREFWNIQAASLFNLANTYDVTTGGSGQPLLSTSHPYDGGTFANTSATPRSLGEASLIDAITAIPTTFVDQAGLKNDIRPETLLVAWYNRPIALRLLGAELRPGTANNDPNVVHDLNGRIKLKTCAYLTSNYPWFLLTDEKSLIMWEREPYEQNMWVDYDTHNLKVSVYERKSYAWHDPRCVYGQMATN